MTLFIICHEGLPAYSPPPGAKIMWLNPRPPTDARGMDIIQGYDLFENPERLHEQLSGCLGAIAVQKVVAANPAPSAHVTIWQYRKFLTREKFGEPSPNYANMHLVKAANAPTITLGNPESGLAHDMFVVASALDAKNISQHYLKYHSIVDLMHFAATLVETATLTEEQALDFFNSKWILPGGIELGTYPAAWWTPTYGQIAKTAMAFVERHTPYRSDDPYQRRAAAFCQERIGTYLLLKHLQTVGSAERRPYRIGTLHTITDDQEYKGGA